MRILRDQIAITAPSPCADCRMPEHPESFPVNTLVPIEGTPLEKNDPVAVHTVLRTIATARIVLPRSIIRLAAGRHTFSETEQAMVSHSPQPELTSGFHGRRKCHFHRRTNVDYALFRLGPGQGDAGSLGTPRTAQFRGSGEYRRCAPRARTGFRRRSCFCLVWVLWHPFVLCGVLILTDVSECLILNNHAYLGANMAFEESSTISYLLLSPLSF